MVLLLSLLKYPCQNRIHTNTISVKYITGGGSKLETKNRVIIYETEKSHDEQTDYDSSLSLESKVCSFKT